MKQNIGVIDRIIRIAAGVVLTVLAASGTIGRWGWIGFVPLITGLLSSCPLYRIFGISTCRLDRK
ncbi:DUF2892 domain-containing protein [Neisseria sp.]|uniref:YgaP family membrane protein n=1 Tax=Neisseria sp. TaxID=192066 RepID=UPI0026DC01E0|nr:DUF2892 domain-containing protein [Neisseria sp.]MDO4908027.1 DUF2892 domain-containing protein [Neisseria sp.]